ncbi:hypothetical protein [Virgisporangium aliadipatigenens]|uniref:hypothetical protein n=1 Tax=Virgisporangium aliadipatigenens TaxID=741659 RepID=UPI001945601F|nr:hypothetical protein [Virgisporangium aliadipatigenens]
MDFEDSARLSREHLRLLQEGLDKISPIVAGLPASEVKSQLETLTKDLMSDVQDSIARLDRHVPDQDRPEGT